MTYDHWKATNPADEFLGPEPVDEPTELELVYEQLHTLRDAVLSCIDFEHDPDASYDEGRWRDLTRYRLAFNRLGFEDLLEAMGIGVTPGRDFADAFAAARQIKDQIR